jgi:hypothetical protein
MSQEKVEVVRRFMEAIERAFDAHWKHSRLIDAGDRVVALVEQRGRIKHGGGWVIRTAVPGSRTSPLMGAAGFEPATSRVRISSTSQADALGRQGLPSPAGAPAAGTT